MPCYYPQGTYRKDGSPTYRPCGGCIGCRLEYSRQWAVRCMHESSFHEENSFLTLTYNPENLPEGGTLVKKDMQKFIKKLRRKVEPKKIRFYLCGEYGEKFNRPHYHVCLFGHNFDDREIYKYGEKRQYNNTFRKAGYTNDLYISQMLSKVWTKGFSTIGELNFESAAYVARYCTKKVTGENANKWYEGRQPEFALMSRMPGIGRQWIEKYKYDVYPKDFHTLNGKKMRPNRYYDAQMEKINKRMWEKIKERRKIAGENKKYESHLRNRQKEMHRQSITKRLERKIEHA